MSLLEPGVIPFRNAAVILALTVTGGVDTVLVMIDSLGVANVAIAILNFQTDITSTWCNHLFRTLGPDPGGVRIIGVPLYIAPKQKLCC